MGKVVSEKKLYDKKQQQILDAFYKEFFTWRAENIGYWIMAGILIFIHGIFMMIPYQSLDLSDAQFFQYFVYMAYMWYLMPYNQFTENRKAQSIYQKIKYLPISLTQFKIYRLKKLTILCLRLLVVFMIGQLFFSFVIYHEITIDNILYPLIWGFAFSYVISVIVCWFSK